MLYYTQDYFIVDQAVDNVQIPSKTDYNVT
jgi:hypothetical protein